MASAATAITETFSIYNPTDADVEVDAVFLGLPHRRQLRRHPADPRALPPVVVFDPFADETAAGIPDGRHAVVFSTLSEPSIVVERVLTRPAGDSVATTVVLGAPPRQDGFVATQWHVGIGPSEPTADALVVYNVDNVEGTITIEALGPGGPTPIAGSHRPPDRPGRGHHDRPRVDPTPSNTELILKSTNRVFVERSLPRGVGADGDALEGRSGSWALPSVET